MCFSTFVLILIMFFHIKDWSLHHFLVTGVTHLQYLSFKKLLQRDLFVLKIHHCLSCMVQQTLSIYLIPIPHSLYGRNNLLQEAQWNFFLLSFHPPKKSGNKLISYLIVILGGAQAERICTAIFFTKIAFAIQLSNLDCHPGILETILLIIQE